MMKVKRSFAVLMIFFVSTIPETKTFQCGNFKTDKSSSEQISVNEEDSEIIEFPYMASYGYLEGNDDLLTRDRPRFFDQV